MATCNGPECRKEISDNDRCIILGTTVNWGKDDLRNAWMGQYTFHSFGCLADWAEERASDHDGHVLREGQS